MRIGHLSPSPLLHTPAGPATDARSAESLALMDRSLGGALLVVFPGVMHVEDLPPGAVLLGSAAPDLDVQVVDATTPALDALDLDVVLALHSPSSTFALRSATPVVLTSEVTFGIRLGIHRATLSGTALARATAGLVRVEAGLLRQAALARSIQANGPAAARAYGRLTADPLVFHDSRIRASEVEESRRTTPWAGDGPLRLGFSGRLDPIKGPGFALRALAAAREEGLPVELHVFGAGPLEARLRAEAPGGVVFRGFRDFHSQWVPEVREEIDVMLLPHVQGDPSCTYFEAMGTGTPVIAFGNATSTPLAQMTGALWSVPRGDVAGMVHRLRKITADPGELHRARAAGLRLMAEHDFETTTRRRAAHLVRHAAA